MGLPFTFGLAEKILGGVLALGLASAGGFIAGYRVNGWRLGEKAATVAAGALEKAKEAAEAARQREQLANALGASVGLALRSQLGAARDRETIRETKLQTEIREVPVYSQCRITATGLQLINDAITDANRYTFGGTEKARSDPPASR